MPHFSRRSLAASKLLESILIITDYPLFYQVTTYGLLLNHEEVPTLAKAIGIHTSHVKMFTLQEFDTEMDFCHKIR